VTPRPPRRPVLHRAWRRAATTAVALGVVGGGLAAPAIAAPVDDTGRARAAASAPAADLLDVDFAGGTATDRAQALPATAWGAPAYASDPDLGEVLRVTAPASAPTVADDAVSFDWAGQWPKISTGFAVECVFRIDMAMPVGAEKDLCSSKEGGGLSIYVSAGNLGTMAHIGGGYKSVLTPIAGNRWYHAMSVWNGTDLTLYVDGAAVGSTPATGAFLAPPNAAAHRFVVGGDAAPTGVGQWAPPATFAGARMWSAPLSPSEVIDAAAEYGFEVEVPEADVLDVDFADGTPVDHAQGLAVKTWGTPTIRTDSALGRPVAEFDGVDDAFGHRFYEQWDKLAAGYTMECTFKFDGSVPVSEEEDVCSSKESGGAAAVAIYDDQLTFNPHTGGAYHATGVTMQAGRWYHAVGTWDGTSSRLYVNGALVKTVAATGALGKPNATATQYVLGADAGTNANAQFFAPVTIAASRVYSRPLTLSEIGVLYAEQLGDVPGSQVELTGSVPAAGDHLTEPTLLTLDVTHPENASGWTYRLDGRPIEPGQEIGAGLRAGEHRIVVTATGVFGEAFRWEIPFTSAGIPTGGGTDSDQERGSVSLSAIADSADGSDVTTTFRAADATVAEDGFQGVVTAMPTTLEFAHTQAVRIDGRQLPEDGATADSASSRHLPFQRYDVDVAAAPGQRIVWSGVADPARTVVLHAWDAAAGRWVEIAESHGSETGDTVLSGRIQPAMVDAGTVHVLVTGNDPFADDLAPRDETAQEDKDSFESPDDYDFSLAHFTDTQYIAEGAVGGTYDDFDGVEEPSDVMKQVEQQVWQEAYEASTQWIADHADERKIAYTAHTGDVTENYISDPLATDASGHVLRPGLDQQSLAEFEFTRGAHDVLEENGIVNQVIAGNHDNQSGAQTGPTSRFSEYFSPQRYYDAAASWPAGASFHTWDETTGPEGGVVTRGQDSQNNYVLFSAGGLDFVAVGLSYGVTQEEADWASSIFERYDDRNGILLTHAYLAPSAAPDGRGASFSADGNRLFGEVVAGNPNVFLVLAGHEHGVGTNLKTEVGVTVAHDVVELLADYQFYTVAARELWPDKVVNGRIDLDGDGVADHNATDQLQFGSSFLRLLQFDVARSQVSIDTYSPYFDNFGATEYDTRGRYNGAEDNLVLPVDLETRTTSFQTDGLTVVTLTDTVIGESTVPSGWPASVEWSGLTAGEVYAWVADSRTAGGEVVRGLRQFGGVFVARADGTDVVAPVLTLPAGDEVVVGETFDPMAGVTAIDDSDGDVTARVEVLGTVDVTRPGVYGLTYVVADDNGNQAIAGRVVRVAARPQPALRPSSVAMGNVDTSYGQPLTLTAKVTPSEVRGTVEFLDGEDTLCTAPVSGGSASCQVPETPLPGSHVVTAWYSGDSDHAASHRNVVLTVTEPAKRDAGLRATAAPRTVKRGKPVQLKAVLAGEATGRVVFTSGGKRLCVATARDGRAVCRGGARLAPGSHRVTAAYAGDARFRADSATLTVRVVRASRVRR
jgi:hypothetical protein